MDTKRNSAKIRKENRRIPPALSLRWSAATRIADSLVNPSFESLSCFVYLVFCFLYKHFVFAYGLLLPSCFLYFSLTFGEQTPQRGGGMLGREARHIVFSLYN